MTKKPTMVKKSKSDDTVSSISGWSDVIRRQGEESRRVQDDKIATMLGQLDNQKELIKAMNNTDLLQYTLHAASSRGCFDPREGAIWQELLEVCKIEVLVRMGIDIE